MAHKTGTSKLLVRPAIDGILAAFEDHPLVGLGDCHELANEGAFYNQLISDPRFAAQVGNVVVEFGSASHQDTLDRYLAGEDVPYAELRHVWLDALGWEPTVAWTMYQLFFAQVRALNLALPPEQQIRVWLGEPPCDWGTIRKREDLSPYYLQREEHPAGVLEREILSRGQKALVIYGSRHLFAYSADLPANWLPPAWLRILLDQRHPGALYVVTPYAGFPDPREAEAFEAAMGWPEQTLVSATDGASLKDVLRGADRSFDAKPSHTSGAGGARVDADLRDIQMGVAGDALLYLAPARKLMRSPMDSSLVMDDGLFREISRRCEITLGARLTFEDWVADVARPPRVFDRYWGPMSDPAPIVPPT
jgi:hypothetical protein